MAAHHGGGAWGLVASVVSVLTLAGLSLQQRRHGGSAEQAGVQQAAEEAYSQWYHTHINDCKSALHSPGNKAQRQGGQFHVAYSSDARSFVALLSSVASLVWHTQESSRYTIHVVLEAEDSIRGADLLGGCLRCELGQFRGEGAVRVQLHLLQPSTFDALDPANLTSDRPSLLRPQTFVRLHLHEYLPAAPRVVWLDHDTILKEDVRLLYETPMQHAVASTLCWAIPKQTLANWGVPAEVLRSLGIDPSAMQFQTGVLVLDLARWRPGYLTKAVAHWLGIFGAVAGEMMALNFALQDEFDVLDWRWNNLWLCFSELQSYGYWRQPAHCIEQTRIFHWAGGYKPWLRHGDRHEELRYMCHFEEFERFAPRCRCPALDP